MPAQVQVYRIRDMRDVDRKLKDLRIQFEKVTNEVHCVRFLRGEKTVALWHRDEMALKIY